MIIYKKRPKKKKDKSRSSHPWFAWYPVLTGHLFNEERDLVWLETVRRTTISNGMSSYYRQQENT
jgi:hypothetical protein